MEVLVVEELTSIDEVVSDIADRSLHLTLGPRTIRPTRTGLELPVMREANKLRILD